MNLFDMFLQHGHNADGTCDIAGNAGNRAPDDTSAAPTFEIRQFKRATHAGELLFFNPGADNFFPLQGMTGPATYDYSCVKQL